jgi:hypothetical protein
MDILASIPELEKLWTQEPGYFFFDLHADKFNRDEFAKLKALLIAIQVLDISESNEINRRFVELVWFIPTHMRWQQDRWIGNEHDLRTLDEAISFVEQRLTTILGLP